jgi:hypothetical protein
LSQKICESRVNHRQFIRAANGTLKTEKLDNPGIQPGQNRLGPHPQFGQVTEALQAKDLLAHPVIFGKGFTVTVEKIPVESGEWAGGFANSKLRVILAASTKLSHA